MPKVKAKASSSIKSQIIMLFVVLIVLMVISTMATLMATGTIELSSAPANPVDSLTDAESICTQRVKGEYGDMVNAVTVDDFSSRFDEGSGEFKMFYQLDLYRDSTKQTGTTAFYVNCFVSASYGTVSRVEYLEQKDFKGKPIRRKTGNIFGF